MSTEFILSLNDIYCSANNNEFTDMILNIIFDKITNVNELSSFELCELGIYYAACENFTKMIHYYTKAIELGSIPAINYLGIYYSSVDPIQSEQYLLMGISFKDDYSIILLAAHYVINNYASEKIIINLLLKAVEMNNSMAMFILAMHYYNDNNYELIKKYLTMSAELKNISAYAYLGIYYKNIENNNELFEKYITLAVDNNFIEVIQLLITYHFNVSKKYDLFVKYSLIAIDMLDNIPISISLLGIYYQYINPNEELMLKYYKKSADLNDVVSMEKLAQYYKNTENYELMINYLVMAVNQADFLSATHLGYWYQSLDVPDYNNMKKYYDIGLQIDNSPSVIHINYAMYYFHIEENISLAYLYYYKAINIYESLLKNSDNTENDYNYLSMGFNFGNAKATQIIQNMP